MTRQRKTMPAIYICGGDYVRLSPRDPCPNVLHDWPLPAGYGDAAAVADARLAARWSNRKCPDCGICGWAPARQTPSTNAVRVSADA